jgi:hypothetical protein
MDTTIADTTVQAVNAIVRCGRSNDGDIHDAVSNASSCISTASVTTTTTTGAPSSSSVAFALYHLPTISQC